MLAFGSHSGRFAGASASDRSDQKHALHLPLLDRPPAAAYRNSSGNYKVALRRTSQNQATRGNLTVGLIIVEVCFAASRQPPSLF